MRKRNKDGTFTGQVGLKETIAPIAVRYTEEVTAILRSLPDRQERIRRYVMEGLIKDGLLGDGND